MVEHRLADLAKKAIWPERNCIGKFTVLVKVSERERNLGVLPEILSAICRPALE